MHSKHTIAKQLKQLGLGQGDLLMVHASLRKIGETENRGKGVLEAITGVIGPEGTLVMVLGSPENVAFDYLTTPADPEMGVLAEIFRTYPGVRLNDHPAARFAILGPLAEELFKDAPLHDYFSNGSVLQKLTDHRGWILRLGADRDTVTLTHWAEYLAEIPDKKRVRRRYVRRDTGELWIESLNDCEGIREGVGRDYFPQILNDFLARGNGRIGQVGNARAELFSAPAFVDFAVDWLEGKFGTSE